VTSKNWSLKNNATEVKLSIDEEIKDKKEGWKRAKDDVSF